MHICQMNLYNCKLISGNQINHPQFSGLDGGFSMEPISPTQFSDTSSEGGIMMMSSQIPLIGTSRHYL
jgi:hypothetical protein